MHADARYQSPARFSQPHRGLATHHTFGSVWQSVVSASRESRVEEGGGVAWSRVQESGGEATSSIMPSTD